MVVRENISVTYRATATKKAISRMWHTDAAALNTG
jgi:hypothetical protein